jgi:hypothetical protein
MAGKSQATQERNSKRKRASQLFHQTTSSDFLARGKRLGKMKEKKRKKKTK